MIANPRITGLGFLGNTPPDIRMSSVGVTHDRPMNERGAAQQHHRSSARNSGYLFRLSAADKKELKARATEQGLTVQAYLERVALGREDAQPRRSGPPVNEGQYVLDVAG